nr:hypothetical protein [Tanacetum cinerariifolium]
MESLRESIHERAKHKREYDRRMSDKMMQSKKRKDNSSKALDVGLVVTESNETESERHVLSSRSGNDTHTDDADINSMNDKQAIAKVQLSAEHNILDNEQQHSEQSESIYDTYLLENVVRNTTPESTDMSHRGEEIDHNADAKKSNIKREINGLETRNIDLESSVARLLAENEKLNTENEHLKQTYNDLSDSIKKTSVQTKDHADSLIVQLNWKPVLQPPRNQSVVRQTIAFKSERPNFSKPQFSSQVDVNNVLSKPVTPHYLPKVRESAPAKLYHVNAPSSSRNRQKELEMPSAKTHHTLNACTPKPRSNNQTSRNWPASKSCEKTLKAGKKADHSRNPSLFSYFKYFVCSTCQECVFNANHDACITKFLKEVNSRAKIQPNKTRNSNKPVDPTSDTQKPGGYRRVEFLKLLVLSGFQLERHLHLAQQRLIVNPQMVQMIISLTLINAIKLSISVQKVEATLKSAWTEKDQIDNLLKERRHKAVRHRYSNPMIQPEPEGSTQGYPLVSVEVLRKIHTLAGNHVKEIILKLNLPNNRWDEGTCFQVSQRFIAACSYPVDNYKDIMKAQ